MPRANISASTLTTQFQGGGSKKYGIVSTIGLAKISNNFLKRRTNTNTNTNNIIIKQLTYEEYYKLAYDAFIFMGNGGDGAGADLSWSPQGKLRDVYRHIAAGIKTIDKYNRDPSVADPYSYFYVNALNALERHIQAVYTDNGIDTPQEHILLLAALDKDNFIEFSNNFMILSNYIKTSLLPSPSNLYEVNAYKNLSNFLTF